MHFFNLKLQRTVINKDDASYITLTLLPNYTDYVVLKLPPCPKRVAIRNNARYM